MGNNFLNYIGGDFYKYYWKCRHGSSFIVIRFCPCRLASLPQHQSKREYTYCIADLPPARLACRAYLENHHPYQYSEPSPLPIFFSFEK